MVYRTPRRSPTKRTWLAARSRPRPSSGRWGAWGTASARSSCSSRRPSTVEGMGVLEDFLTTLPEGFRYAVEVRHKSWLGSDLAPMLREHGAALTLIDYPRMPRMEEATAGFVYIRWLGNRRGFPSGHTHAKRDRREDLAWWSERVDHFLSEGREVFAYANNHYQNHSPSTLEQFLEIRRKGR
jgi:uncharacterized protein YecE (DUF72 family)